MKRRFYFITILILFVTCKEVYNPPFTSPATGYLVVEGFINSGNGTSTITLTRTTKLVDSVKIIYEHNALVNIEDENNGTYPLQEKDSGNYVSDILSLNPSLKYRIHIKTTDGREYVSDFTAVKQTPPIDSITWNVENGGVQLYVNSHDPKNETKYYQWKYTETWEFHSTYIQMLEYIIDDSISMFIHGVRPIPPNLSIYKCWRTQRSTNILIGSTEKLSSDQIYIPVRYIPPQSYELSVLYHIELKQYALSKEAYLFKEKLKKNTEQLGSIFDAQPSELGGNIHCVNDPSQTAIGYVDVTQEQVLRKFISHDELSGWITELPCIELKIDNSGGHDDPALIPITVAEYRGRDIASYYAAQPECVDCTLRGTNVRPAFWPR